MNSSNNDKDLIYSIVEYCIEENTCSINLIQSKFSIGFNKTARIINLLEDLKIVSKKEDTNKRTILVDKIQAKEIISNSDFTLMVTSKPIDSSQVYIATEEDDELVFNIAKYCIEENACSINLIQSKFSIGFNRASSIISQLEEKGIVSKKQDTKPREILVDIDKAKELILSNKK